MSPDYLVRPRQHVRRNRQADLLGGFEIDDQLELRRLLDRKIGGFCAFEDFIYIHRGAPISLRQAWRITHQTTSRHPWSLHIDCRQAAFSRDQGYDSFEP